jgi:F0F1-type ATP synthase membrane subunit c/vacuolar-type H+-ATPase subunit K
MNRTLIAAGLAMAAVASSSAPSSAQGFIANTFIRPFSPSLAKEADRRHAEMGNPLDRAANGAAGAAVGAATGNPALGAGVTGALEARDAARRRQQ